MESKGSHLGKWDMISQQRNDVHDLNDLTKDQNDAHLRFAQVQLRTISNNDFYVSQTSLLEMDGLILRKKRGIGHNSTKKLGQHMTTLNTWTDTANHLQYMCSPAFHLFPRYFCVDPSSAAVVMPKVCQLKSNASKGYLPNLRKPKSHIEILGFSWTPVAFFRSLVLRLYAPSDHHLDAIILTFLSLMNISDELWIARVARVAF